MDSAPWMTALRDQLGMVCEDQNLTRDEQIAVVQKSVQAAVMSVAAVDSNGNPQYSIDIVEHGSELKITVHYQRPVDMGPVEYG